MDKKFSQLNKGIAIKNDKDTKRRLLIIWLMRIDALYRNSGKTQGVASQTAKGAQKEKRQG